MNTRTKCTPFPDKLLEIVNEAQVGMQNYHTSHEQLSLMSEVASLLADLLGLPQTKLELSRVSSTQIEDLRQVFIGKWRFSVFNQPATGRLGFLALDPMLVSKLALSLMSAKWPEHLWYQKRSGENGLIAAVCALIMEKVSEYSDRLDGWRYLGLAESIGEVGRACAHEDVLQASWIRIASKGNDGFTVWLEPGSSALKRPARQPGYQVDLNGVENLNLTFASVIARCQLSYQQLSEMQVGDVLVLDDLHVNNKIVFRKGELEIQGLIENEKLIINKIVNGISGGIMNTNHMDNPNESDAYNPLDVSNLPVELTVEAGNLNLTVSQIAKLIPGQVFGLPAPILGLVDIRSSGRLLARGELVNLEGYRGVRIVEVMLAQGDHHENQS
jgi:flagellar motor switch/type III secretory pathway protein FliN